jgi:hypothetical protein
VVPFSFNFHFSKMHTFRGSFAPCSKNLLFELYYLSCKSKCCHLTPKRGRLKEHTLYPSYFVC